MKYIKLSFLIICLVSIAMGCSFKEIIGQEDKGDQQLMVLIPAGFESNAIGYELVKALKDAATQIEVNYPGAKVTLDTDTSFNTYDDRLFAPEKGQKIPDIILVSPNKMNMYSKNGILTDLSNYANEDDMSTSDLYAPLIESSSRDGMWLSVPFIPDPQVIYYNKDWFDQANLAYPDPNWTWEDFAETSKLLKGSRSTSTIEQYGGILGFDIFSMETLIMSSGGSILSPDGRKATGYLDSDASARAVQYMINLYRDQKLDLHSFKPSDARSKFLLFSSNSGGMFLSPASTISYALPDLGDRLGIANLPSFESGIKINPTTTLGLSIMGQSDDKELAWELLKLLTFEQNEITQRLSEFFLVNNEVLANSTGQANDPLKKVMLAELNYSYPSAYETSEFYEDIFMEAGKIQGMLDLFIEKNSMEEIKAHLTVIAEYIDMVLASSEASATNAEDEAADE